MKSSLLRRLHWRTKRVFYEIHGVIPLSESASWCHSSCQKIILRQRASPDFLYFQPLKPLKLNVGEDFLGLHKTFGYRIARMGPDTERAERGPPRKPWLLKFRSSNGFILATVCVAIFTVRTCSMEFPFVGLELILARRMPFSMAW